MARIDLIDIAHSYRPNPAKPSDYALRPKINLDPGRRRRLVLLCHELA